MSSRGWPAGLPSRGAPSLPIALLAWLGLAAIHGGYDFAVFASAPGAPRRRRFDAPRILRRVSPGVALRALLRAAETTAAALAGAAAIAASRAPRAAPRGRLSRALGSRLLGRLIGVTLAGGAVVALGAGRSPRSCSESADLFLRAAAYAVMPLALGVMFIATPAAQAPASPRSRRAWAGVGVAAALALAAAAWTWGPAQWRLLDALRFEARGVRFAAHADYGRAIEAYGEALAIEPGRVEVLSKRAEAYAASNRYDAALADLDVALRAAPATLALYIQRAELNRRRNDPGAAARDLDAALQRKPGDAELLALRAQARLEAGDAQGADDDLAEARAQGARQRRRPAHLGGL